MTNVKEVTFLYGYEVNGDLNPQGAIMEAFKLHMAELNNEPRPLINLDGEPQE